MSVNDPTDLRGQELTEAERKAKEKLARQNEESDWKWLMSKPRGRRIVWQLLEQAGVFRSSFDPNNAKMAFNEGNRNYGLRTLMQIQALCPELYPVMVRENTNVSRNDDGNGTNPN